MADKRTEEHAAKRPAAGKRAPTSRQKAKLAASLLAAKKAQQTVILDLRKLTVVADYFVICTGMSDVHVRALAEDLAKQLKAHGLRPGPLHGVANGRWVLLDLGDVIIHIFAEFERSFYALEQRWVEAPSVSVT